MFGISFLKSRLLRIVRNAYNSGNYEKSAKLSQRLFRFFRDRDSLDILARSHLRLGNYADAVDAYRIARTRNYVLMDHHENHFRAELEAGNIVHAFSVLPFVPNEKRKYCQNRVIRELRNFTENERNDLILEMRKKHPLPPEIAELLPSELSPINQKITNLNETQSEFKELDRESIRSDRYIREISKLRGSISYQISKHISDSTGKIGSILSLPFTLTWLILKLLLFKLGVVSLAPKSDYVIAPNEGIRDCIVFFPTNGVGFGHFTRLLSIAKEIQTRSKSTEIVFFTTMPTLQVLAQENFVCYHLPGRYRYNGISGSVWDSMCEEMLNLSFSLHRPKAFVFDGSYPYRGMLNSINSQNNEMLKVWVRRRAMKRGSSSVPSDSIAYFDAIVRPDDSMPNDSEEAANIDIPVIRTNPILLDGLEGESDHPDLRKMLGVPKEATLCYVQLGAGQINDIDSELNYVLSALNDQNGAYAVLGESMLGPRFSSNFDRVRTLRDYPNSRYFSSFDFAVIAGGYNSYHEVIEAGLPSICLPNMNTGMDDQFSRCSVAAQSGAMVVLKNRSKEKIAIAISRMMDENTRAAMRSNAMKLRKKNGNSEVAEWLLLQS